MEERVDISLEGIEEQWAVAQANDGLPRATQALMRAQILATLVGPQSQLFTAEFVADPNGDAVQWRRAVAEAFEYVIPETGEIAPAEIIIATWNAYKADAMAWRESQEHAQRLVENPKAHEDISFTDLHDADDLDGPDEDDDEDFFADARKEHKNKR